MCAGRSHPFQVCVLPLRPRIGPATCLKRGTGERVAHDVHWKPLVKVALPAVQQMCAEKTVREVAPSTGLR